MKPLAGGSIPPWRAGGPVDESDAVVVIIVEAATTLASASWATVGSITTRAGTDTQEGVKRGHALANDWPAGDGAGRGRDPDKPAMMNSPLRLASEPRTAKSVSVTPAVLNAPASLFPAGTTPHCQVPKCPVPRFPPVLQSSVAYAHSHSLAVSCFDQRHPDQTPPACVHGS